MDNFMDNLSHESTKFFDDIELKTYVTPNHDGFDLDKFILNQYQQVKNTKNIDDYVETILQEFQSPKFATHSYKVIKK